MRGKIAVILLLIGSLLVVYGAAEQKPRKLHDSIDKELKDTVVINGKTYYFFLQDLVGWSRAGEMCASRNLTLATLDTAGENADLLDWLADNQDYDKFVWTSLAKLDGSTWRWESTGADLEFSNWRSGEPDVPPGTPACMNLSGWPRGWWDDTCDLFLVPLCQQPTPRTTSE